MQPTTVPAMLLLAILLIGVSWSFSFLLLSDDLLQHSRHDRGPLVPIPHLLICGGFILAISGISLLVYHGTIFVLTR